LYKIVVCYTFFLVLWHGFYFILLYFLFIYFFTLNDYVSRIDLVNGINKKIEKKNERKMKETLIISDTGGR